MALFSRRSKATNTRDATTAAPVPADVVDEPPTHDVFVEPVPSVGISVSSFDALGGARASAQRAPEVVPGAASPRYGQTPAPTPPAEAPPAETVAGVPENVLLRDAVDAFVAEPDPRKLIDVARQLMQGQVYLRVKGDARALLTEGRNVPFALATRGDQRFAAVFSGPGALSTAMRTDGESGTSALGQPVQTLLRQLLAGPCTGVVIDSWPGRNCPVLPRALVQMAVDEADPHATIKTLLAAPRTAETVAAVAIALAEKRVWMAANRAEGSEAWGIAESRSSDGSRHLSVFTHPLEVAALGRGDRPVPITPAQLAGALTSDTGLDGVIVDPAGPWLRLSRDDLAPVRALAAAS